MPNTNNGLPYPLPTDFLTDGATAIKALADAVDVTYDTGAWRLAADQILTTGVFTVLNTTSVVAVDAAAFTMAAGAITVLKAGAYEVTAQVRWDAFATGRRYLGMTRNTPSIDGSGNLSAGNLVTSNYGNPPGATVFAHVLRSSRFTCAANDVVRVFAFHDAGSALGIRVGTLGDYLGMTQLTIMRVTP